MLQEIRPPLTCLCQKPAQIAGNVSILRAMAYEMFHDLDPFFP